MTITELQELLKGRSFTDSANERSINFKQNNTFNVNGGLPALQSAMYEVYEENGSFYLKHNGFFGSEDFKIEFKNEDPLTTDEPLKITLTMKFSLYNAPVHLDENKDSNSPLSV